MNELNLLLIPSTKLGEHHTHEYVTGKGTPKERELIDFVVSGEMSYTWIDGDKPEDKLTVEWAYYGQQDDISKAYGSALTYSERYFLLKCLGLPTDEDDPDGKDTQDDKFTNVSTKKGNLSEGQIKRLYAIGKSRDVDKAAIDKSIITQYKKNHASELTKQEYDDLCGRLEALPKKE